MVTVAPGTTAPEESVTVPVMVALAESWANAPMLQVKTTKAKTKIPRKMPDNRETRRAAAII
jgi:hypothetical protein